MAASEGLAAAAAGNDEGPSMHEMEGPRRVLLPCGRRSLGVRRPCRTCSACSVLAIARLTRSWNGLLVAVCRSRSLGSSSYAELAPRGPPVPIAQVQLLRRAVAPPTWPDRSGPASAGSFSISPAAVGTAKARPRRPTFRMRHDRWVLGSWASESTTMRPPSWVLQLIPPPCSAPWTPPPPPPAIPS